MKQQHSKTRGFTLIELLVVIAIIALLIGLLLPALAKAQRNAQSMKDKTQIRQIHSAFLIFANDSQGILPTPGRINRLPIAVPGTGQYQNIPGQGQEHHLKNHTRHLYSAMIAQRFFNTDLVIGPTEVSEVVEQYNNYNYDQYDPSVDTYWDGDAESPNTAVSPPGGLDGTPLTSGFLANIHGSGPAPVSYTSYAHMAICGHRKKVKWQNTQATGDPIIGTRGTGGSYEGAQGITNTYGGQLTGEEYTDSPTLDLHGARNQWVGNVVFNDNHVETLEGFFAQVCTYQPRSSGQGTFGIAPPRLDNMYAAEFQDYPTQNGTLDVRAGGDAWMGIFTTATQDICAPRFDDLE